MIIIIIYALLFRVSITVVMSEEHLILMCDTAVPYSEEPNFSTGLRNLWCALNVPGTYTLLPH